MSASTIDRKAVENERREAVIQYKDSVVGNPVPELASGTWLNTQARSLAELRGQFVMLDFWFIGCGPCERDIPNIKLAQEI